jgi:peptidyl-prolyl cis-trans isomerase SurA
MLSTEYREGILLFEIMEKEVWNKASEDSLGQRKYYQDHLSQFKAGNRLEARIFSSQDKAFLEEMKEKMRAGDTLRESEMKKFKSVVHWKVYDRQESQIIDQINWIPGLQLTELKGTYYLVDVSRLVPPGTKSFDEARAAVISAYQDFLEKKWLQELRQKYQVSVNKKHKQAVIAELSK